MEGISHCINKTQFVKTLNGSHSGPAVRSRCFPDSPKLSKNFAVAPELLSAPHSYTRPPPGLAPALEAAWGQPSNQIKTSVRCALNRRQQKTESRGSKGPRDNTTPENTEVYLKTCTGHSELSRSPEREREPHAPNTKGTNQVWAWAPAPG